MIDNTPSRYKDGIQQSLRVGIFDFIVLYTRKSTANIYGYAEMRVGSPARYFSVRLPLKDIDALIEALQNARAFIVGSKKPADNVQVTTVPAKLDVYDYKRGVADPPEIV